MYHTSTRGIHGEYKRNSRGVQDSEGPNYNKYIHLIERKCALTVKVHKQNNSKCNQCDIGSYYLRYDVNGN